MLFRPSAKPFLLSYLKLFCIIVAIILTISYSLWSVLEKGNKLKMEKMDPSQPERTLNTLGTPLRAPDNTNYVVQRTVYENMYEIQIENETKKDQHCMADRPVQTWRSIESPSALRYSAGLTSVCLKRLRYVQPIPWSTILNSLTDFFIDLSCCLPWWVIDTKNDTHDRRFYSSAKLRQTQTQIDIFQPWSTVCFLFFFSLLFS